jgi:HSP20 family molecular chaperone IbpA
MNVNVCVYPKTFEIGTNNFDNELDALLDRLLEKTKEKNDSQPSVSGKQTANAYLLEIKFPSLTGENMEVNFENGSLTIQSVPNKAKDGTKKRTGVLFTASSGKSADFEESDSKESRINPFRKIYRLPKDADPQGISASFCNGILSLEISKKVNIV